MCIRDRSTVPWRRKPTRAAVHAESHLAAYRYPFAESHLAAYGNSLADGWSIAHALPDRH